MEAKSLTASWREKVEVAEWNYAFLPTPENHIELRRVLQIFSDLIIHSIQPRDDLNQVQPVEP